MFDREEPSKTKGKKTTGFSSFPSFIQPGKKDNSVWAGTSMIKLILIRTKKIRIRT